MASTDELLATIERRPDEEWIDHQSRLANLARRAQDLGPEHGAELLRRVWVTAEYRDVFFRIAQLVEAWGAGSIAFLRARLADDPERALSVILNAHGYGAEGLDALAPDVDALASSPDPEVAEHACTIGDRLVDVTDLARRAQDLGPEHGAELLLCVWVAANHQPRDFDPQIAMVVKAWGAGGVAFLRARLADDPRGALNVLEHAHGCGAEGLDALVPDLRALASSPEPDLAQDACTIADRLDGTEEMNARLAAHPDHALAPLENEEPSPQGPRNPKRRTRTKRR
jgi:hypothetical protein